MIEFIVNTCVVCVIVRREHTMLDERLDTDRSEDRAEAYVIVPFVGDGASKVARVPQATFDAPSPTKGPMT